MKKFTLVLPFIVLLFTGTVMAQTIYTDDAIEYSNELKAAYGKPEVSLFSVSAENASDEANAGRTLMLYYEGELNDENALFDICDEDNIHTLIYSDSTAADAAYRYYTENDMAVCHDEILTVNADSYLSWGPEYIGTPYFAAGLRSAYGSVSKMPPVTVAVIDTGVDYRHSFLSGRVDASLGYDFYNNDNDPMDDHNHGTHVAGIIADNTLSNVTIVPIKVANRNGYMTTTDLKSGIQWAVDKGVNVINLSLSSSAEDRSRSSRSTFSSLFNRAYNNGIVMCAAAGNADNYGRIHNASYIFPAYMDNTVVVANCTSGGGVSRSSNYGTVIDLSAPGSNIYSTIINNEYANMTGTSMACPFVAAAAALLITRNPGITPSQVESEVRSNAKPYPEELEDDYAGIYGAGILDLSDYYFNNDPSATPKPTAKPTPTAAISTATPDTGTQQLISDIKYDENGILYALITNTDNILNNDAEAIAVGYKDGVMKRISNTMSVKTDGDAAQFRTYFKNADSYDYIKLFVWDSLSGIKPLSRAYTINVVKTGESIYTVTTIKE